MDNEHIMIINWIEPPRYSICIKEDEYTTGGKCYVAWIPEMDYEGIHRCMGQGDTVSQAIADAQSCLEDFIGWLREDGLPVPEPRSHLPVTRGI